MEHYSGVGVLDKSVRLLEAVAGGARSLADLTDSTGLSRATAHRLAVGLEGHRLLSRDEQGRWLLGARLGELAAAATDPLLAQAPAVLEDLRGATGESAQLYRRQGRQRRCLLVSEHQSGLRDTVPVGALLPMTAGSAAQVLLAWQPEDPLVQEATFSKRTLSEVRRRGWAASAAERESGVASVSAPVWDEAGAVVAAVSVSGPIERLTRSPGRRHSAAVVAAAHALSGAKTAAC